MKLVETLAKLSSGFEYKKKLLKELNVVEALRKNFYHVLTYNSYFSAIFLNALNVFSVMTLSVQPLNITWMSTYRKT